MVDLIHGNSVHESIQHHCLAAPEAHCFSLFQQNQWTRMTRGEFWAEVERYANLFSHSFSEKTLILFIKRLSVDLLAAYIGAIKAGHLPAQLSNISAKTTEAEYRRKVDHILQLTGAGGVFTDIADAARYAHHAGLTVLTPAMENPGPDLHPPQQWQALIQFSSGSTGLQKGVVLTHDGILAHMRSYSKSIALSPDDRLVSWLPLYHDMGLIACFLMPLMAGIPFYQMDPFDWIIRPNVLLELIEAERATLCYLPNFAYHVLINKGKPHDLSSMRLVINCSEPARRETHLAFHKKFPSVPLSALAVCYALAENTFAVSQTPVGQEARTAEIGGKSVVSCGTLLPGNEIRVLDADSYGVGEIALRGSFLFDRFLGADLPLEAGFYRTGDLGFVSEQDEVFITGRKKDLIISNGKNVYPQDVEHACSLVPGAYPGRVVSFGVANEQTGSEDLFVIIERDGSVPDTQLKIAVQKAVEVEVGLLPKRVEVLDHMRLVKTSSGKISRSRNKELFLKGELT